MPDGFSGMTSASARLAEANCKRASPSYPLGREDNPKRLPLPWNFSMNSPTCCATSARFCETSSNPSSSTKQPPSRNRRSKKSVGKLMRSPNFKYCSMQASNAPKDG
jgi:hypothetical protein